MRSWLLPLSIAVLALVAAPAVASAQSASAGPASAEPAKAEPASAGPASSGSAADDPRRGAPPVPQSARRGPEVKEPYQWRLMLFGAGIIVVMFGFVVWVVRRQTRR